jgi:hypothetical protein
MPDAMLRQVLGPPRAMISARHCAHCWIAEANDFGDPEFLVTVFMQVIFFVTPVMFRSDQLPTSELRWCDFACDHAGAQPARSKTSKRHQ